MQRVPEPDKGAMTEIGSLPPGLAAMLSGQQQEPTPEQVRAAEAEHARQHREQREMVATMAFWAPLLCDCSPWPAWPRNTRPPQEDCMIHGHLMMNACTGYVYAPGQMPPDDDDAPHAR